MRWWTALALVGLVMSGRAPAQDGATPAQDQAALAQGDTSPVDYARTEAWLCRAGGAAQGQADGTCDRDLDAMAVNAAGARTPQPFAPAAAPPIDCFYVYPTTSDDPTIFSDLSADGSERRTVHAQAAHLSSVCRLFVPVYHQVTSAGLRWQLAQRGGGEAVVRGINTIPYRDIRAAWAAYLAHDNQGRGVVLVGHSQGAILLQHLLASEIDGTPAQRLLVGAYLAGNADLGRESFRSIAPCAAVGQTGCLVAWSSYADDDMGERAFGGSRAGAPVCVNPAAIGGGRGLLKPILTRPALAPAGDPPFVAPVGQLSAACVTDVGGAVLRVRVEPGRYERLVAGMLALSQRRSGWGLHPLDISLVEGNLLDDIAAQAATWRTRSGG